MKRASMFARFFAFFLDIIIVFFLCIVVLISVLTGYIVGHGHSDYFFNIGKIAWLFAVFCLASVFLFAFYFTYLSAGEGSTIGKRIFNLRIVRQDGMHTSLTRSLLRSISYFLSASVFFIGFLMAPFFRGKALHDFIADTQVIEEGS